VLKHQPYLVEGMEGPSIGDISCYAEVAQLKPEFLDVYDFSNHVEVLRWMERMEGLSGHDEAHDGLAKYCARMKKLGKLPAKHDTSVFVRDAM